PGPLPNGAIGTWPWRYGPTCPPPAPPLLPPGLVVGSAGPVAQFVVNVPADAAVWIEDAPTSQAGPVRVFGSPPLPAGGEYAYAIRARWLDGDRKVEQRQEIHVHPGDNLVVTFPLESPAR